MEIYQNIIIGSGPTGVIAANDILKFNRQALILDIGNVLEKENHSIKEDFLKNKHRNIFLSQIRKKK